MKNLFLSILILLTCSSTYSLEIKQDEGKYRLADIENDRVFEKWFKNLQLLITQNQREKVANLVHYPLNIILDKREMKIKSKKEFLSKYNSLITSEVKKVIVSQKIRNLTVTSEGVMIGTGQMWINVLDNEEGYWITAINNNFEKETSKEDVLMK